MSSDRTAASRRMSCCCSTGCSNLSCSTGWTKLKASGSSKAKCSASCSRPKEPCSDQTAAEWSCSKDWLNLERWCSDSPSVRCCSYWYSALQWSSWKTTMTAPGCSLMVVDLTAAEPTLDSATCSAARPVFAIDPEWCYSMCWASLLNFEQARNQRSSPVPFLICTGSSSFGYSL